jgi:hypothetical protein
VSGDWQRPGDRSRQESLSPEQQAEAELDERDQQMSSLRRRVAMRRRWIQRKAARDGAGAASGARIPESGGAALGTDVRAKMEPQLGADLSAVRVHTGGESAKAADAYGARAFTVGGDVHFAAGEFAPGSKEGDRLLAHELTHIVQGQRSGVQRKADAEQSGDAKHEHGDQVSKPGEPAEQEADQVADHVADNLHEGGEHEQGGEDEEPANPDEIAAVKAKVVDGGEAEKEEHGGAEPSEARAAEGPAADVKQAAPSIGAKLAEGVVHAAPKTAQAPAAQQKAKPKPGATVKAPPGRTGTGKTADPSALPVKVRQQQDAQQKAEKNVAMPPDKKRPADTLGEAKEKELKERLAKGDRTITKAEVKALDRGRRLDNRRARGVGDFWARERAKLKKGEKPTRNWTPEQTADILAGKTPKGPDGKPMEGHHMFGVKDFPQAAATGQNIHPATDKEHTGRWHGGDTKAETDGKPRNPEHPEEF